MNVADVFQLLNFLPQLHVVGGAVRDTLLGRTVQDFDFTTQATPQHIEQLCQQHGFKTVPTGIDHGTVTVLLQDGTPIEVTTFRLDVHTDGRHAKVEWGQTLEQDLARRDFTINAIAQNAQGHIIDPFDGRADLQKGVIRTVGSPYQRFEEDYLRVIRAGRFAGRFGFDIEPQTWQAIVDLAPKVIDHVAVERITAEISKAFKDPTPSRFLHFLYTIGILPTLLPEFAGTHTLMQNPKWHPEGDVWTHTLEVVDRAPIAYRWHALLHDVGKKASAKEVLGGYHSFHGHEHEGAEMIADIAERLKLSSALRDSIEATTRYHMAPLQLRNSLSPKNIRKFQAKVGPYLSDLYHVCKADGADRRDPKTDILFEPQPIPIKPILQGRHLIDRGHKPDATFKAMLRKAFKAQLEHGIEDLEVLYQYAIGQLQLSEDETLAYLEF